MKETINATRCTYSVSGVYYICILLGMVYVFFPQKVFVLVFFFFPLVGASHDTELAHRSVRAHTLLNVNNQDFSKTSVSRQTFVGNEDYHLGVVFNEVHSCGM